MKILHWSGDDEDKDHEDRLRKKLAEIAQKGAAIENLGRMCGTCAFKLDSDANLEPHNVQAAWDCLAYEGTFNCHIESGVNKGCECIGFKYAKAFFENRTTL